MKIAFILSTGRNGELGKRQSLIWKDPDDMIHFKNTTLGACVIMGRKTFKTLGDKSLRGRYNIVVSTRNFSAPDFLIYNSFELAIDAANKIYRLAPEEVQDTIYVIGGAKLFEYALPYADEIYHTAFDAEDPCADTWFNLSEKIVTDEWKSDIIATYPDKEVPFVIRKLTRAVPAKRVFFNT